MKIINKLIIPYIKNHKYRFTLYFILVFITYSLSSLGIPKILSYAVNNKLNIKLIYIFSFLSLSYCIFLYLKNIVQNKLLIQITSYVRNGYIRLVMTKLMDNYKEIQESELSYHSITSYWSTRLLIRYFFEYVLPFLLTLFIIIIYFFFKVPVLSYILIFHALLLLLYIYFRVKKLISLQNIQEKDYENSANNYSDKMKNLLNIIFDNTFEEDFKEIKAFQNIHDLSTHKFYNYSNSTEFYGTILIYSLVVITLSSLYFLLKKKKIVTKKIITEILFVIIIYLGLLSSFTYESFYFSNHLSKIIRADKIIDFDDNTKCNLIKRKKLFYSIEFKNVYFKYDKKYILKNFNIKFTPKKINIITGKSGTGKTTIMKLIIKLIRVNSGQILFDGINSKDLCRKQIIDCIYYVNQRTTLFNKSVFHNIQYGNNSSYNYIISLLYKYDLYQYYSTLMNGINTLAGVNGSNLSLGMQKIIMVLRGILKPNKSIVIFDEPLTSLDLVTREKISRMIYNECQNKTVIIISHDDEIMKYASKNDIFKL